MNHDELRFLKRVSIWNDSWNRRHTSSEGPACKIVTVLVKFSLAVPIITTRWWWRPVSPCGWRAAHGWYGSWEAGREAGVFWCQCVLDSKPYSDACYFPHYSRCSKRGFPACWSSTEGQKGEKNASVMKKAEVGNWLVTRWKKGWMGTISLLVPIRVVHHSEHNWECLLISK